MHLGTGGRRHHRTSTAAAVSTSSAANFLVANRSVDGSSRVCRDATGSANGPSRTGQHISGRRRRDQPGRAIQAAPRRHCPVWLIGAKSGTGPVNGAEQSRLEVSGASDLPSHPIVTRQHRRLRLRRSSMPSRVPSLSRIVLGPRIRYLRGYSRALRRWCSRPDALTGNELVDGDEGQSPKASDPCQGMSRTDSYRDRGYGGAAHLRRDQAAGAADWGAGRLIRL